MVWPCQPFDRIGQIIHAGFGGEGRGRGRPRTAWLDNIKSWMGRTSDELNTLSKDRKAWRQISLVTASKAATQQLSQSGDR